MSWETVKACFRHKGRDDGGTHLAYNPTWSTGTIAICLSFAFFPTTEHAHGAYVTYLIKLCGLKGAETTLTTCPLHHSEATTCLPAPSWHGKATTDNWTHQSFLQGLQILSHLLAQLFEFLLDYMDHLCGLNVVFSLPLNEKAGGNLLQGADLRLTVFQLLFQLLTAKWCKNSRQRGA